MLIAQHPMLVLMFMSIAQNDWMVLGDLIVGTDLGLSFCILFTCVPNNHHCLMHFSSRPHGNYMFFPLMLTTVAFVLSVSAHSLCNFVSRTVQLKNGNEEQSATNQLGFSTSVGIWSFMDEAYELCFKMPFDDVDAYYQTARTMSSLASAFGGILLIIMWFSPCIGMKTQCWVACGIGLVLVSLFESLTFLIFESDLCHESENFTYNCTLNNGGKTGIAAAVFWFLASVSVCYVPPPGEYDAW